MIKHSLSIVFIGWNENGEKCLQTLIDNHFVIVHLITPKGYDVQKMHKIAETSGIPFNQDDKKAENLKRILKSRPIDLLIVASYPYLIQPSLLNIPRFGAINVHGSKLPLNRGYHPLNWAIIRDEKEIAATVHYIDAGIDSGDILKQKSIHIRNEDDINTIREKITSIGAKILLDVVSKIDKLQDKIPGTKQDEQKATLAPKRSPQDSKINWLKTSREIFNLVRALHDPYPNAFSETQTNEKIDIKNTYINNQKGSVIGKYRGYYLVTTGDGVILIKTNRPLKIGDRLN